MEALTEFFKNNPLVLLIGFLATVATLIKSWLAIKSEIRRRKARRLRAWAGFEEMPARRPHIIIRLAAWGFAFAMFAIVAWTCWICYLAASGQIGEESANRMSDALSDVFWLGGFVGSVFGSGIETLRWVFRC